MFKYKIILSVVVILVVGGLIWVRYSRSPVVVDQNTSIVIHRQKEPEAFTKELQEFQKKTGNEVGFLVPSVANAPVPFTEQEIEIDDLKINDQIFFSFAPKEGATILESSFVATEIIVNR